MTPLAFLYVAGFTLLVAGAAAAMEWGLQGRFPVRHVWTVAMAMALLVPATTIAWKSLSQRAPAQRFEIRQLDSLTSTRHDRIMIIAHPSAILGQAGSPWIRSLESSVLARVLLAGWLLLSLSLALWIAAGFTHWRRARRKWKRARMDGVEVHVSDSTGPAVLGILSHQIVVPGWASGMPSAQRELMLAHECEHVRARDPQRLAMALLLLVIMPWNAALWWCAARLRRAIELDCDARVLKRFPGAREYGYLLLEVAARARSSNTLAVPLIGLLRMPSELELRLKAMTRKRSIAVRTFIAGSSAALIAIAAAFTTPVPRVQLPAMSPAHRMGAVRVLRVEMRASDPDSTRTAPSSSPDLLPKMVSPVVSAHAAGAKRDSMSAPPPADHPHYIIRLNTLGGVDAAGDLPSLPTQGGVARRFVGTMSDHGSQEPHPDASPADPAVDGHDDSDIPQARMLAAVTRYFPELIAGNTVPATVRTFFFIDSAGQVVRVASSDSTALAAATLASSSSVQMPGAIRNVDPAMIKSVMIEKKTMGSTRATFVWLELKRAP